MARRVINNTAFFGVLGIVVFSALWFLTPHAQAQDEMPNRPTLTMIAPSADTWDPTSLSGAPHGRYDHTAIWTGEQMIVWGGYYSLNHFLNDGGKYDPSADSWHPISTAGAPIGRLRHSAVWTGEVMIIWGGESGGGGATTNTGGIYDPVADTWSAMPTEGAPSPREEHSAVWTGQEMIIWGGCSTVYCSVRFANGARFNPETGAWTPMTSAPWLGPQNLHQAVWTGSRMIVWGGSTSAVGGSYDPVTDTWTQISSLNTPTPSFQGASVWTGEELLVWGGCTTYTTGNCTTFVGGGGRYNLASDSWSRISATQAPTPRYEHTAVWTGTRMIVWGGCAGSCYNDGALYDPVSNTWSALSAASRPASRGNHRAVWTGQSMVVWGGCGSVNCSGGDYLNTGGRYWHEIVLTGSITGTAWNDLDGDGNKESGEPGLIGVTIKLFAGGAQIGQTTTTGIGSYGFESLAPGTYQVRANQPTWLAYSTTPNEKEVMILSGKVAVIDFGDWSGQSVWLPLALAP